MSMTVTLRLLIVGCAFGGILCEGTDPAEGGDTLTGAAKDAYIDIRDESHKALVSTVRNTGKAGKAVVGALGGVVNYGLWATADNSQRAGRFFSETLPRHSKKIKDSTFTTLGLAADHTTNAYQRVQSGLQEAIKATDDVSQTILDESTKVIGRKGEAAQSLVKLAGTVGTKAHGAGKYVYDKTGDFVTKPSEYLTPVWQRLPRFTWGSS